MNKGYGIKCNTRDCRNEAIHIHHRDKNHSNNDKYNLEYLCASCHRKAHSDDLDEDGPILRHRDSLDEISQGRVGYRLTRGFNLLSKQYD
jgi:5-methylcytosine-specific restriction endonuclease McrA